MTGDADGRISRRTAIGGLAGLAVSAACRTGSLRTIRVGTLPRFVLAPLYVADELGYFRDAGLAVDVQLLTETTQTIPLLAAGSLDVSLGGATPAVFNAIAQGAKTRIVAAREQAIPDCTEEVHGFRGSFPAGFDDASLLRGKRVAVTAPTSLTAFLLDVLLQSAGLSVADVHLMIMRLSESAPALVAGQLDAVVDLDMGFLSPAVIAGPSVARLLPGFQYSYIHFGSSLLEGDTEPGAAFLRAYFKGVRQFLLGTVPKTMDRLAQGSGMNPDGVRTACRRRLTEAPVIDPTSIQRMIDWARSRHFLRTSIDVEQVVDRRFLDTAFS